MKGVRLRGEVAKANGRWSESTVIVKDGSKVMSRMNIQLLKRPCMSKEKDASHQPSLT